MTTRPSDKELADLLRNGAMYAAGEGNERLADEMSEAADSLSQPTEPTPDDRLILRDLAEPESARWTDDDEYIAVAKDYAVRQLAALQEGH